MSFVIYDRFPGEIWLPPSVRDAETVPPLMVLGRGIQTDGTPTDDTVAHADVAAELLLRRRLADAAILSGRGSNVYDMDYPVSEAEVMHEVIKQRAEQWQTKATPTIYEESESGDTWENFLNSAPIIEENRWNAISVVTEIDHMPRARSIARRILGKHVETMPIYAQRKVSLPHAVSEIGLMGLIAYRGRGVADGDKAAYREIADNYARDVKAVKRRASAIMKSY